MSNDLLAQIRAKRQTFADAKNGSKGFYKFKPGTTLIRILPSWRDESASERPFYHDFGQSFIKDMDGNLITVIGDRRMTYGEDDPVRNLINLAISEAPTDAQREHYRQMLAKQSYIVNVQVMNDSAVSPDDPQLVSFSRTQMDQILKLMEKLLLKGHNPLDLENGFDLEVDRTGTKVTDTRYSYNFERDSRKVNPDVMTRAVDLDSYVRTKFAESDRAINAIKSISQGALLPAPGKAVSLTSDKNDTTPPWENKIEDAEYTAVDDAKAGVREPINTNTVEVSQDEIDKLLAGL